MLTRVALTRPQPVDQKSGGTWAGTFLQLAELQTSFFHHSAIKSTNHSTDHSFLEKMHPSMSHLDIPCSLVFGFLPTSEKTIRDKQPPTCRGVGQNGGYLLVLDAGWSKRARESLLRWACVGDQVSRLPVYRISTVMQVGLRSSGYNGVDINVCVCVCVCAK